MDLCGTYLPYSKMIGSILLLIRSSTLDFTVFSLSIETFKRLSKMWKLECNTTFNFHLNLPRSGVTVYIPHISMSHHVP
ncbi:hypothetical protein BDV41DRAFT_557928 [Aspergillus transmontanensis]|uniref:Uncharacterized protein n=1 Tax=Aspergillus transmontanensis TaxID=1034304 RepID=A0A5N6VDU7_9EURO|nr:hypothetical protein BDV41DRAFT_557928 [Aspergillus transmontanensis]